MDFVPPEVFGEDYLYFYEDWPASREWVLSLLIFPG